MLLVRSLIPVLAICLASCSGSGRKPIEIVPDKGAIKPPIEDPSKPGVTMAAIKAKITEAAFKDHLDFTKPVAYKFSYFSAVSEDSLTFVAGEALVEVNNLQVGVAGDMTLTLLQDNVPILRAINEGQILQLGGQSIKFTFKLVDQGGDDNGGGTDNSGGGTDNSGGGTDNSGGDDNGGDDDAGGNEDAEVTIEVTIEDE